MKLTFTLSLLAFAISTPVNSQNSGHTHYQVRMELGSIQPGPILTSAQSYSEQLDEQLKQSDALKSEEQKLKEEIAATQQRLLQKQIAVSRLRSHVVKEAYAGNELRLRSLLANEGLKAAVAEAGSELCQQAAQALKMAVEMREEADAQLTPQAQLAAMSNAEEKEILALAKQQEAIVLLKQATPLFIKAGKEFVIQEAAIHTPQVSALPQGLPETEPQASNLKQVAGMLREAAGGRSAQEQAEMLAEAQTLEQEYLKVQTGLALSRYHQTQKTFEANRQFIRLLLTGIADDSLGAKAKALSDEADYLFRLGKEMREEADAQLTPQARLAEMSNAEEKESLAIGKQQQSVAELKKLNLVPFLAMN